MKRLLSIIILLMCGVIFGQRPKTGDKIYLERYPAEQTNFVSSASLVVSNTTEDDMIVVLRDGGYHFISHVYVRAHELYVIENLPVGHFIYQYFNLKTYFESPERIPIEIESEQYLNFFYSTGAKKIIGFEITEEQFFSN